MAESQQPDAVKSSSRRAILAMTAPAAGAVVVFGVIYGSLARPLLGAPVTMLSSLVIFSGAVQFLLAGLLLAGAAPAALVVGSLTLNVRNLVLGAVMRPRVRFGALRRAGLAWFLTDESTGLALSSRGDPAKTLVVSGALLYIAWQVGTAIGLLGATLDSVRSAAEAVFPVLFIALAAMSTPSRGIATRAALAACIAAIIVALLPGGRGIAAVLAAAAVSVPGAKE